MNILVTSIIDLRRSYHNRLHQLLKHLSGRHEITVFSINDWWKAEQADQAPDHDPGLDFLNHVQYAYLTEKRIGLVLQELFLRELPQDLLSRRYDLHINYNSLLLGCQFSGRTRTLFDMADDLVSLVQDSPQLPAVLRPLAGLTGNLIVRQNIARAGHVTVTTPALQERYRLDPRRSTVIPNGVDATRFRALPGAREQLGLTGFIVGYVGALREWVDLQPVFYALKQLDRRIKLLIVGHEGRIAEYEELAHRLDLADRIIFTGLIPYGLIPLYVSAMDVCLVPFRKNDLAEYSLPLKLFEYLACERPVVSSDLLGVRTAVGGRILYASGVAGWVEQIDMLYRDRDLRLANGVAGREFVVAHHDWSRLCERFEQLLLSCR